METETRLPVALRGYDRDQVDALLERITATLRHGRWGLTADEVRGSRFDIVLRGYEQRAVDDLLQEAVRELQAAGPARRPARRRVDNGWLAGWVRSARFPGSGVRAGYDVRDVDAFLERVVIGLHGRATPMTARDVRECAFRSVRFGPGYDVEEVDRFLVQLAGALERR